MSGLVPGEHEGQFRIRIADDETFYPWKVRWVESTAYLKCDRCNWPLPEVSMLLTHAETKEQLRFCMACAMELILEPETVQEEIEEVATLRKIEEITGLRGPKERGSHESRRLL